MGLLDDAIREHLDLKRRRGADPTEVERQAHEALGPVRRGPEDPSAGADALSSDEALAPEDELDAANGAGQDEFAEPEPHDLDYRDDLGGPADPDWDDAFKDEPAAYETRGSEASVFDADAPAPARAAPEAEPPSEPEPHSAPEPPAPHGHEAAHPGAPTIEYDVEDALSKDPEAGDDVLEETPDFLQDTPEHDRLWFEQRPPRDFKFDD
jgi:hypothetical protein